MSKPEQTHQGTGVYFQGTIGAQKRLASCHLVVLRIVMYKGGLGNVWEADTDKGKRWISYSEKAGWQIAKAPPQRPEHAQ
jgi:hypothetical protein